MNKVSKLVPSGILLFILLSCSAFPAGRVEQPAGKQEARVYWILDGTMSAESAEMYLERYLFPTSLALMLWTEFTAQRDEVRFDTLTGYRVVRKQRVLSESIGTYTVYGYDLIIDIVRPDGRTPAQQRAADRAATTYDLQFSYPESVDAGSAVLPQPLEQALLAGIRQDGRSSGRARVERIEYLGSGRFTATVLVAD
jgi:hypothetical protein